MLEFGLEHLTLWFSILSSWPLHTLPLGNPGQLYKVCCHGQVQTPGSHFYSPYLCEHDQAFLLKDTFIKSKLLLNLHFIQTLRPLFIILQVFFKHPFLPHTYVYTMKDTMQSNTEENMIPAPGGGRSNYLLSTAQVEMSAPGLRDHSARPGFRRRRCCFLSWGLQEGGN